MNKQFLTAVDFLTAAAQHAYCADHLLQQNGEIRIDEFLSTDALLPIISLIHSAFALTFKAFLVHEQRAFKPAKNLIELAKSNHHLGLSQKELQLIGTLSRQNAFHKGLDYLLFENREQLQVFCSQMMGVYERLQSMIPVELQQEYLA